MAKFLQKTLFFLIGSVAIISGSFSIIAIAGASGGLGDPNACIRVIYTFVGILPLGFGIYLYYLGSNMHLTKLISELMDALLLGL